MKMAFQFSSKSKELAFTNCYFRCNIYVHIHHFSINVLVLLTSRYGEDDFLFVLPHRLIIGLVTLFLSITTMVMAFSSALYLVHLFGSNHAQIIGPVIGFACLPILSFISLQFPLLVDSIMSTYGSGIFSKKRNRLHFY
ncbi:hypothetical protein RHMOL_Rhmol05G0185500 [Rhododendron molle]|uniref:Uncharacterized protein n=1 Tax=Rhododendron molle TaxID=49168 RepID=A0ACC0NRI3_RHOML|nr:hypothetical protein RHMOL_Rhmol05G0185500 [Rhododendron molle]